MPISPPRHVATAAYKESPGFPGLSHRILEATTGFEPVMGVLQTPALDHLATSPLITIQSRAVGHGPVGLLVPRKGFEPLRPKALPPQDSVSASSTTSALSFLAGVEGLEPPTYGFGDRCSSQLSYTPMSRKYNTFTRFEGQASAWRCAPDHIAPMPRTSVRGTAKGTLVATLNPPSIHCPRGAAGGSGFLS
jgi:hypothetical protein